MTVSYRRWPVPTFLSLADTAKSLGPGLRRGDRDLRLIEAPEAETQALAGCYEAKRLERRMDT